MAEATVQLAQENMLFQEVLLYVGYSLNINN